jgi:serine/threonine protein kinase
MEGELSNDAKKKGSDSGRIHELNLSCSSCSLDLGEQANSDNRAEELAGTVLYLCEVCAEKEQKDMVAERVGTYRILSKLGRGEMTAVYKVWHEPTCRLLALKKMLPEFINYQWARIIFEHEINIGQELIYPTIVRSIDHGGEQGTRYCVNEYMAHGDLYTYTRTTSIPVTKLCTLFCHVLKGLAFMHEKGYVHRDVKPQNMLLNQDLILKISDFALAKRIGEEEILDPGWSVGPFAFASPEQILHFEDALPPSDVYSVGMSFYHILTDRFPISFPDIQEAIRTVFGENATNTVELMRDITSKKRIFSEFWKHLKKSILEENRVPVQCYRKDIPSGLAEIIDRSVARYEEDQFSSADEMRCSLTSYSQ